MTTTMKERTYYERLNEYFPAEEMKHPNHLESLLKSEPYYHKQETDDYLLLYAKFPGFIFVDYLLVTSTTRGSGIGSKIMKGLQKNQLPILLEVEKASEDDPDTKARLRFYRRHGFKQVQGLTYRRFDDEGNPFEMDILVWTPSGEVAVEDVHEWMTDVCDTVHNHRAEQFYEEAPADPEKVLSIEESAKP